MLNNEQIAARFPRLILAMRRVACLTQSEAVCAIYMRRNLRDNYAGEAVNHFGGVQAVLSSAIRHRHAMRRWG
jgi:hypothetical protein